jgi:hypothetical protein
MYIVRYEDIEFEEACNILRKNSGFFDADSRSLVVSTIKEEDEKIDEFKLKKR